MTLRSFRGGDYSCTNCEVVELRNRVYELVVEHDRRVENITHCREPSRFIYNPSYRWKIQGARDWKRKGTGVRYYSHAGLAGVCRQVRREYLPREQLLSWQSALELKHGDSIYFAATCQNHSVCGLR